MAANKPQEETIEEVKKLFNQNRILKIKLKNRSFKK